MKLLLVEDDFEIRTMLKDFLEQENYEVICAADGELACACADAEAFDLVLLDLMIPKVSGMDVMQHIRASKTVPIIILSAKASELDKTLGLGLGADDYVTKPFSMIEVLARIKSVMRRTTQYSVPVPGLQCADGARIAYKDLEMNLDNFTVTQRGRQIELTAKEFALLKLLLQNPKKVYTKEQLYAMVWKDVYYGDENAVNVLISRLRSKIEETPRTPRHVITVWGIGYKLGD